MKIDDIYRLFSDEMSADVPDGLETAMENLFDTILAAGAQTEQIEPMIHAILSLQEKVAFKRGFLEGFDLCENIKEETAKC